MDPDLERLAIEFSTTLTDAGDAGVRVGHRVTIPPGLDDLPLDFIQKLVENEVRILPSGNAGVVEAVARGEADVGMTDTDDVWAAKARDLNVELVYPSLDDEQHAGTLLIPNTVSIIKGGPNPRSARLFAEYLLSEQVERLLAESVSHNIPLRPDLAADYPEFKVPKPMEIDYAQAARSRSAAINLFMESLRGNRNATQSAGAME
jgi:ABC-type Fe3+ transport system substrate-binding protein